MQTTSMGGSTAGTMTGLSLESIFLLHFLAALERLQVYLGEGSIEDEEPRWMKVNLQFQYLIHLLPRDKQKIVEGIVSNRENELKIEKEYSGNYTPMYISRMEIVTSIVEYLTQTLDLTHEDIIASLTPKARDHAETAGEVIDIDG